MSDYGDTSPGLHLFEGYGIELEYMIVANDTLDVLPVSDEVLRDDGKITAELERGGIAWSNELVLHVIELKTNGPATELEGLPALFAAEVTEIEARLREHGGCLMPTAMHPWMDPSSQTRLWPHEYQTVYRAFDRIFDCAGHGWSNVQSTHINLPYQGDDELRRLHGAIRLVLPILPAIAASSPIVDGRATGWLDTRIEHYRRNCQRIPSVTGHIVPEVARSEAEYRERILDRIAGDIGPLDPDHYLDPEWVNARGAIVRFVRDSIEIRIIDVQEQPRADLAIAALTVGVLRELIAERFSSLEAQEQLAEAALEATLLGCAREGEQHLVTDARYLRCLGLDGSPCSAAEVWRRLRGVVGIAPDWDEPLDVLLEHGSLARRVLGALERDPDGLHAVYRELCACLADGRMFMP